MVGEAVKYIATGGPHCLAQSFLKKFRHCMPSSCVTRVTYRVVTATLPPQFPVVLLRLVRIRKLSGNVQKTDEMNAEDGQKAPSVCVSVFNVEHK